MVKNRLKDIITTKGLKQNWLSEQVGVTPTTLGNIINNRFNTSLEVALRLAIVLEMKVEDIFEIW